MTTTDDDDTEVAPPETVGVPGVALQLLLDAYTHLSLGRPASPEQSAAWDSARDTLDEQLRCT